MRRKIIRFCHGLLTAAELLLLIAALLYAGYSLWDNRQVYDQVENVTKDLREIKSLSGDDPLSMFDQLRFINPDVHAWITMEGTAIDYPVLKGRTNFTYINTDVYGNFALLGSIFMDFRNSADFSNLYTVLLGHDMTGHRMFSDVNLYKDEAFFRQHTTGILTLCLFGMVLGSAPYFLNCFLTLKPMDAAMSKPKEAGKASFTPILGLAASIGLIGRSATAQFMNGLPNISALCVGGLVTWLIMQYVKKSGKKGLNDWILAIALVCGMIVGSLVRSMIA